MFSVGRQSSFSSIGDTRKAKVKDRTLWAALFLQDKLRALRARRARRDDHQLAKMQSNREMFANLQNLVTQARGNKCRVRFGMIAPVALETGSQQPAPKSEIRLKKPAILTLGVSPSYSSR